MRRYVYCLVLLLLPLSAHAAPLDCVFFTGFENTGTTAAAANAALQVHNCARRTVEPAASVPMAPLVWDASAASAAQSWANQCTWAHGGLNGIYGQNIYAAAGYVPTLADAALAWASERIDYTYASNSCTVGAQCGHYTQMIWADTTAMGCGQAACSTGSPFVGWSHWSLIVCDYAPPGNYIGQWPY